jgi:prepilin-type N-terminal cleavage/methylation domain-containing protein
MSQRGFTLIEVLVVIAIIGVLAAIAIPQFQSYKSSAFDRRAQIDLRNTAIAEEAYFLEADVYTTCTQASCPNLLPGLSPLSQGTVLQITATSNGFTGTSTHPSGTGKVFSWPFN